MCWRPPTASAAIGTINAATLTAGLTGTITKTYDGTNTAILGAGNYTLSGTVYGNDVVALNNPTSGLYSDANAGTTKIVGVSGLTLSNANYVLATPTASAAIGTINAATLTAGLTGTVSKTYDGTATATLGAGNYVLTGTVYGNDAVALNNPTSGLYSDANAGTTKTVGVSGLTLSNANYVLAAPTASAAIGTINAATLTAGLTGTVSKTYDGTNTAILGAGNYTLSGTVYGNDVVALNNPTSGALFRRQRRHDQDGGRLRPHAQQRELRAGDADRLGGDRYNQCRDPDRRPDRHGLEDLRRHGDRHPGRRQLHAHRHGLRQRRGRAQQSDQRSLCRRQRRYRQNGRRLRPHAQQRELRAGGGRPRRRRSARSMPPP